jgi:DNA-binding NarL/FixJ family response regulator
MNVGALRILVVDDHAILRHGLRLMLAKVPAVLEVDEAASCLAALKQVAANPPDLVLMDAHLPEINGIEGTRQILAQYPGIKVILLSGDSSASLVLEALKAGAMGYVIKENSPEEIARAVHAVMSGKGYFSPEVAASLARYCRENPLLTAPAPATQLLTDHEKRLLQLIAQGKRNKEMAVVFNIATKSVEAYRSRLMAKLGCSSPAELTRFAIREGIVSP